MISSTSITLGMGTHPHFGVVAYQLYDIESEKLECVGHIKNE